MFSHVAVIGAGLLGGSLCKALKAGVPGIRVDAYGRDASRLAPVAADGSADRVASLERFDFDGVELIAVSVPVVASIPVILDVLGHSTLGDRALVVDVGSVKGSIVSAARTARRGGRFIGCHPMAGSEQAGYDASDAGLYRGVSVIVTPHGGNDPSDVKTIVDFWELLGARTLVADPDVHDRIIARTSHLPHCAAAALVRASIESMAPGDGVPFTGGGFIDTTRISSGSPDIWDEICRMNGDNIVRAIDDIVAELSELRGRIASGTGIREYFEGAKKLRDGFYRVFNETYRGRG